MIELMVTVAVLAILSMMAAPAVLNMLQANAISNNVNAFVGALQLARSEAIKNASNVVVCKAATGGAGNSSCASGSADWNMGWLVFLDRDRNGAMNWAVDSSDRIIKIQEPINNIGPIVQNTNAPVVFNSMGLVSAGVSKFTFNALDQKSDMQKLVCISRAGRVRVVANSNDLCD